RFVQRPRESHIAACKRQAIGRRSLFGDCYVLPIRVSGGLLDLNLVEPRFQIALRKCIDVAEQFLEARLVAPKVRFRARLSAMAPPMAQIILAELDAGCERINDERS